MDQKTRPKKKKFVEDDVKLLISIMQPFLDIIESKQNNSLIQNGKKCAWAKITELYNASQMYGVRTDTELKKKWDNLKTKLKMAEKASRMKTRGGEKSDDEEKVETSLASKVQDLIRERAEADQNVYDNDESVDSISSSVRTNEDAMENPECVLLELSDTPSTSGSSHEWQRRRRPTLAEIGTCLLLKYLHPMLKI